MGKRNYTVRVTREGKWWMAEVADLDVLTQARRLAEVEDMVRSAIALTLDVAPGSFELRVELTAIEDVRIGEWIDRLTADRADLEAAQARYRRHQREAARRLAANGVPMRDIGTVLGVSHQRAQQLVGA